MALKMAAETIDLTFSDDEAPVPSKLGSGTSHANAILIDPEDTGIALPHNGMRQHLDGRQPASRANGSSSQQHPQAFQQAAYIGQLQPSRGGTSVQYHPSPAPPATNQQLSSRINGIPPVVPMAPSNRQPQRPNGTLDYFVQRSSLPIPPPTLPKFHQPPTYKAKPKPVAKTKIPSRPHPQASDPSSGSPDRKRIRLDNGSISRDTIASGAMRGVTGAGQSSRTASPSMSHPLGQTIKGKDADGTESSTPGARTHHRKESKQSSSSVTLQSSGHVDSTARASNTHLSITSEADMFPMEKYMTDYDMRQLSTAIAFRLNGPKTGPEAIYRTLKSARTTVDLVQQLVSHIWSPVDNAKVDEITSVFSKSFQDFRRELGGLAQTTVERKTMWMVAALYQALTVIGGLSAPQIARMPDIENDIDAWEKVVEADEVKLDMDEQDDVDMIDMDVDPRRQGTLIKKHAYYRDVDVLRIKGRDVAQPRPYLGRDAVKELQMGTKGSFAPEVLKAKSEQMISVPFADDEVNAVRSVLLQWYTAASDDDKRKATRPSNNTDLLSHLAAYVERHISSAHHPGTARRKVKDYLDFLKDLDSVTRFLCATSHARHQQSPLLAVTKKRIVKPTQDGGNIWNRSRAILRRIEMTPKFDRAIQELRSTVLERMDDSLTRDVEFSGGPGDITSFTWLSGDKFISGAITNCDLFNQDYNKPGNIVIGCAKSETANAIPAHRIPRPPKPQKSDAPVIETQDPWLYCSVAMTAFHPQRGLCFTGSYDKTVKVWRTGKDRNQLNLLGTWHHDGNVNLVVTSQHHGKVATACDVKRDGVRVYDLDDSENGNIDSTHFQAYSGSRASECANRKLQWAYFPSTIQWGLARNASHYLLAGFSPRALDVHSDVPADKRNSGQLCVWDTETGVEVTISGPKTQNVFEVAWHPSQAVFVAATSATTDGDEGIRTQLRLFVYRDASDAFTPVKTFDCRACDINEITLKPTSYKEVYLTASCTDRKTYVWDSAQGERPIHTLCHDAPIDQLDERADPEDVDAGVKFAAWGRTADRFFTGSSDGVVKAWNVRAPTGEEFLGDVLYASGGISCGLFSPDRSRLAIGDASGRIYLLKNWDSQFEVKPTLSRTSIRPFYEPSRPNRDGIEKAREFVANKQIVICRDKYIGAVQGDNYHQTNLYRKEMHPRGDLEAIPEQLLQHQNARRRASTDILALARLSSAKFIAMEEDIVSGMAGQLRDHNMSKGDARLIAAYCSSGLDLQESLELRNSKLEFVPDLPTFQAEADVGDVFKENATENSLTSPIERKLKHLSVEEEAQFFQLKEMITCEHHTRVVFEQVAEELSSA